MCRTIKWAEVLQTEAALTSHEPTTQLMLTSLLAAGGDHCRRGKRLSRHLALQPASRAEVLFGGLHAQITEARARRTGGINGNNRNKSSTAVHR